MIIGMFNKIFLTLKKGHSFFNSNCTPVVSVDFLSGMSSQLHHLLKIYMRHPKEVVVFFLDGSLGLVINDKTLPKSGFLVFSSCIKILFLFLRLRRQSHNKIATSAGEHASIPHDHTVYGVLI